MNPTHSVLKVVSLILLVSMIGISCANTPKKPKETVVLISTDFGEIKLKLFDETPEHKKNFIKLIEEGFYDDLLFHRVIENFMIQGGDPDSRNAQAGVRLGGGGPGYTVPAEIRPDFYHKKGAIAAARRGGPGNPEKRSSGCQFYIVQGEVLTPGKLDTLQMMKNSGAKNDLMKKHFQSEREKLSEFQKNQDHEGLNIYMAMIREKVDSIYEAGPKFSFSEEQVQAYTTIGGYPSLDGEYTVFGEVIEGLEVLDEIAAVQTDQFDRPESDIQMKIKIIE